MRALLITISLVLCFTYIDCDITTVYTLEQQSNATKGANNGTYDPTRGHCYEEVS
jgi:hypothetical protein